MRTAMPQLDFYPHLEDINIESENQVLFNARRAFRSSFTYIAKAGMSAAAVAVLWYFFGDLKLVAGESVLNLFNVRLLMVIPLFYLAEIFRRYHDDLYEFRAHRITHKSGRLSLNYSVPIVKYMDIRAITVEQDVWGRMLNYGNVTLGTAAQDTGELYIEGVIAPWELGMLVDQLRSRSRNIFRGKEHYTPHVEQELAQEDQPAATA